MSDDQTSNTETPEGREASADSARTTRSKGRATSSGSPEASRPDNPARKVHLVLQGKGGIGKTYVASLLAESIAEQGAPLACIDADPVNASFAAIPALKADAVDLLVEDRINVDALDAAVERMLREDANFVIDSGAASFSPLSRYLIENAITDHIAAAGKRVLVHTIVTGDRTMLDTLKGLAFVIDNFPKDVGIVVWLNEFFGPVVNADGNGFEQFPVYLENRHRLAGIVRLAALNPDTFGRNLREMQIRRMTFAEALDPASTAFHTIPKSRLFRIWQPIREQLTLVA